MPPRQPVFRDRAIEALRRQRLTGNRIAGALGLPRSTTVGTVQRRLGLGRLKVLDPPAPVVRYHREPGELLHLDTKKLGRIDGVGHPIIGMRTHRSATAFLGRAPAWFAGLGVSIERITDNGSAYRCRDFQKRVAEAGIRHIRTRPYTPKTNGKAESFIQTSLREWAYACAYQPSAERGQAMLHWITSYIIAAATLDPRRHASRLK